jgi:hypothetical protein
MDAFSEVANQIVKEQKSIIGPLALDQARMVEGLVVEQDDVKVVGNGKDVLTKLVNQYAKLFGQTSIEVCKEAFRPFSSKIPATDVPDVLKG